MDQVVELVVDLAFILTHSSWGTEADFWISTRGVASDLADLLVFGDINNSANTYDVRVDTLHRWYWRARERFLNGPPPTPKWV
jgi:hypothetical protein